jgi:hypothetical protein
MISPEEERRVPGLLIVTRILVPVLMSPVKHRGKYGIELGE